MAARKVALVTGGGPEEGGEFTGDRGFLGEYDSHDASSAAGAEWPSAVPRGSGSRAFRSQSVLRW